MTAARIGRITLAAQPISGTVETVLVVTKTKVIEPFALGVQLTSWW